MLRDDGLDVFDDPALKRLCYREKGATPLGDKFAQLVVRNNPANPSAAFRHVSSLTNMSPVSPPIRSLKPSSVMSASM